MARTAQGLCRGRDARVVGAAAAARAQEAYGRGSAALALVYATPQYDAAEVLAGVVEVLGDTPAARCLSGGTVSAVIACEQISRDGVGVFLCGEGVDAAIGVGALSEGAGDAGRRAAGNAAEALGRTPDALMLVPAMRAGGDDAVLQGALDAVGPEQRLFGGRGTAAPSGQRSSCYAADRHLDGGVVGLALHADAPIGLALRHGCQPFGPPLRVTRADGPSLVELEWQPAWACLVERIRHETGFELTPESLADFARLHPLGLAQAGFGYALRDPLGVDAGGTIDCSAQLPEGHVARTMRAGAEDLTDAATEAARAARAGVEGEVSAALVLTCESRHSALQDFGVPSHRELEALREGLGDGVPIFGCLTEAQLGRLDDAAAPLLHSRAIQVCALPDFGAP